MENAGQIPFETFLEMRALEVEALLHTLLDGRPLQGEIERPSELMAAMRHGVLAGGKRLRPFLVMESAALFDADPEAALRVAAALECIHCYSLIHDDLPAMDNDDLRRGLPTVHRAFGEAAGILAGDSLLTYAFDIIADPATTISPDRKVVLILALARAAGPGGMAGGQALDLQAEKQRPNEAGIIRLQAMKTGALIRFGCEAGAILGGASDADRERLAEFGSAIGLAFQLADDLLDLTATAETMGKATGKDAAAGKATLVSLHGMEWAQTQLAGLVDQAHSLLDPFGERSTLLKEAARFIATRKS
ncbi:polyprenyl synthetase family protein [Mesorhizobium sp. SB112]|uniref:polyprenyl synthetase family protein n=1 Tax=Mesorhizobium sp. SB112 TaxID=3151853 RepID=UPI0032652A9D